MLAELSRGFPYFAPRIGTNVLLLYWLTRQCTRANTFVYMVGKCNLFLSIPKTMPRSNRTNKKDEWAISPTRLLKYYFVFYSFILVPARLERVPLIWLASWPGPPAS